MTSNEVEPSKEVVEWIDQNHFPLDPDEKRVLGLVLDQYTAPLRAEVEALRARVALLEGISADGEGLACMVQGYSTLPTRVLREAEIVLKNVKTVRSQSE